MGLCVLPSVSYSHFTASARNLSEEEKWAHENEAGMRNSMEQNLCKQESTLWPITYCWYQSLLYKRKYFHTQIISLITSQQPQ